MAKLFQKFEVNTLTISKWESGFLANLFATLTNVKEMASIESEVTEGKLYVPIVARLFKKVQINWGFPRGNGSHMVEGDLSMVDWLQERVYP